MSKTPNLSKSYRTASELLIQLSQPNCGNTLAMLRGAISTPNAVIVASSGQEADRLSQRLALAFYQQRVISLEMVCDGALKGLRTPVVIDHKAICEVLRGLLNEIAQMELCGSDVDTFKLAQERSLEILAEAMSTAVHAMLQSMPEPTEVMGDWWERDGQKIALMLVEAGPRAVELYQKALEQAFNMGAICGLDEAKEILETSGQEVAGKLKKREEETFELRGNSGSGSPEPGDDSKANPAK